MSHAKWGQCTIYKSSELQSQERRNSGSATTGPYETVRIDDDAVELIGLDDIEPVFPTPTVTDING